MVKRRYKRKTEIILPSKLSVDQATNVNNYLARIYYNTSSGGAFSSASKIYHEVKRRGYYKNLGLKRIQNFLNTQQTHLLYKPSRKTFSTPPVITQHPFHSYQMDLADMSRQASSNNSVKYLLTCIDIFSKMAYAEPLVTKTADEVSHASQKIFNKIQGIQTLTTDRGKPFNSNNITLMYIFHNKIKYIAL